MSRHYNGCRQTARHGATRDQVSHRLGRFEEAAAAYEEAFRLNPDDADLRRQYTAALANIRRATPDHRLKLRDGRWLGYLDFGDPDGAPVILCHGTPGSRLDFLYDEEMLKDLHIRAIVPDRPGYGLSDFQRHRRLLDWPADVEQLADHLGLERFAVLGVSGGGPHAAACAYAIPHRLTRVGLISSAAPLELAPLRARLPIERLTIFTARYFPWPVLRVTGLWTLRSARANPSRSAHISSIRVSARPGQSFKSLLAQISSSGPIVQTPPVVCEMVLEPFRQGVRGFAWDVRTLRPSLGISPGHDPWRRGLSLAWRARRSRLDCGGARAGHRYSRLSGDVLSERNTRCDQAHAQLSRPEEGCERSTRTSPGRRPPSARGRLGDQWQRRIVSGSAPLSCRRGLG